MGIIKMLNAQLPLSVYSFWGKSGSDSYCGACDVLFTQQILIL